MKLSLYKNRIILILFILFGCKSEDTLNYTKRGEDKSEKDVSEDAVPPANITGTFLYCRMFSPQEEKDTKDQIVGCGLKDRQTNKMIDVSKLSEKPSWNLRGSKMVEMDNNSQWHVLFKVTGKDYSDAKAKALEEQVEVSLGEKVKLAERVGTVTKSSLPRIEPVSIVAENEQVEELPMINEFVFNHAGDDDREYIEIKFKPGGDLSSYHLLVVEGDCNNKSAGGIIFSASLDKANAEGYWVTPFLNNKFQNGSQSILLVENYVEGSDKYIDKDKTGSVTTAKWSKIIDSVAVSDGGEDDIFYSDTVFHKGEPRSLVSNMIENGYTLGGASRMWLADSFGKMGYVWVRNGFYKLGLDDYVPNESILPVPKEAWNTPGKSNKLID